MWMAIILGVLFFGVSLPPTTRAVPSHEQTVPSQMGRPARLGNGPVVILHCDGRDPHLAANTVRRLLPPARSSPATATSPARESR
jgi:hypothetical protein